jgi:hypothetical protein
VATALKRASEASESALVQPVVQLRLPLQPAAQPMAVLQLASSAQARFCEQQLAFTQSSHSFT